MKLKMFCKDFFQVFLFAHALSTMMFAMIVALICSPLCRLQNVKLVRMNDGLGSREF